MPEGPRANPFVGPVSYLEGQILYGRRREAAELADLIISRRVVLLYSPSGAGKTSVIRTRLRRELEVRGKGRLRISPVIRVNYVAPNVACNRYVLSVLRHLENSFAREEQLDDAALAKFDLTAYLEERWGPKSTPDRQLYDLLVFDQFEEIFTLDPVDRDAKRDFFEALGAALGKRDACDTGEDERSRFVRWGLFSMREDFIAELDEYRDLLPTSLATRYRLNLLDRAQAREAIQSPAADAAVEFRDDAVERVLDELTKVRISQSGAGAWAQGKFVEPVQLQVVCRRLWAEVVTPQTRRIALEDLTSLDKDNCGLGEVDAALSAYYDEQVRAAAQGSAVRERVIREWIDAELITPSKVRSQVLRDGGEARPVTEAEIDRLIDGHVLRSDERGGRDWVEITHDRLINPIVWSNNRWLSALPPLLQQSRLWERSGRQDGYLLAGDALVEAESWAQAHEAELQERDRTFLLLSRHQRERADEEKVRAAALAAAHGRLRRIVLLLAFAGFLLLGYAVRSHFQRLELTDLNATNLAQRHLSEIVVTLSQADRKTLVDYRLALERVLQADARLTQAQAALAQAAPAAGWRALDQRLWASLRDAPGPVRRVFGLQRNASGGSSMAAQLAQERISVDASLLDALRAAPPIVAKLSGHRDAIRTIAMSPDGTTMVSAGYDGRILLWDRASGMRRGNGIAAGVRISALAYHAPTGLVAAGDGAGMIRLWRFSPDGAARAVAELNTDLRVHGQRITGLAFEPSGEILAAASWDRRIALWDVRDPARATPLAQFGADVHRGIVYALAYNREGTKLATADWDGRVLVWDALPTASSPAGVPRMRELVAERTQTGRIALNTVAFSPDSRFVAAGGHEGSVLLWPLASPGEGRRLHGLGGHDAPVFEVAFSANGEVLASVGLDKTLILWDAPQAELWRPGQDLPVRRRIAALPERLYSVAFDRGTIDRIAIGGSRSIFLLDASGPASPLALRLPGSSSDPGAAAKTTRWEGVELVRDGTLVLATRGAEVWAWDISAAPPRAPGAPAFMHAGLTSFAADANGARVVTGNKEGEVLLWRNESGTWRASSIQVAGNRPERVNATALAKDGSLLAAAIGNVLYVWNVADPAAPKEMLAQAFDTARVRTVAFSPVENLLAVGGTGMPLQLWRAQGTRMVAADAADPARQTVINDISFASDGKTLATGDEDMRVVEWTVQPLASRQQFTEHERGVRSVVLATREAAPVLFSADRDGNVLVRLGLHDERHARMLLSGYRRDLLIAGDARGERLVTTGDDVSVWDLRAGTLRRVACSIASPKLEDGTDPCALYRH